jgi:DNA replicative helicase MCM subunit Mcm2 (Cdc46/Mcm family)
MRRAKLPTLAKKVNPCKNCGAHVIQSYDYFNGVYKYQCQNCGATRYEPSAKFSIQFKAADSL